MSTLDANRTQVGSDEDDSKLMLSEDEGTESQRLLSYDGTKTIQENAKERGESLNEVEQETPHEGETTKLLSDENGRENEESVSSEKADQSTKGDAKDQPRHFQPINENFTPENVRYGQESDGDGPNDDYFSAKTLLCFAWQIAQGMVSRLLLFSK